MFTRIKAEREKRGIEQKELAARIGIAVPTLGNYEAGRREPPLDVLCAVADIFDISLDLLVRGKEKTALKDAENAPKPVPAEVVNDFTASYESFSRKARKAFWSRLLVRIIPTEDGFLPVFDRNDNKQLLFSLIVKMGI